MINVDMRINLDLIGDSWSGEEKAEITKRLLQSYTPTITSEDKPAGVNYTYIYNFKSEPDEVSSELFKFIDSISVKTRVPTPILQWMLLQHPALQNQTIVYKLIDALRVEDWLAKLKADDGYTLYFLKPSKQQLGYLHTYSANTTDPDTGNTFGEEGMMGFGGKHRFYFIDLSAGPWFYPYIVLSETNVISQFHKNIFDVRTDAEYYDLISNYVNDAITLLFTPSYLYSPIYKSNYKMEVLLIDMTSGRALRDISSEYIQSSVIEEAFAKLIPYAQWSSEISGHTFDSLPRELQHAVLKSLSFHDTAEGVTVLVKSSTLATELRNWVNETLGQEEQRVAQEESKKTVFVPIVLFVFDSNAFVDKVPVVGTAIPDPSNKALPCCAVAAVNKHSLFDVGSGLSTLAIHEMAHVLGLRHPHDGYSPTKGEFNDWFFDWSYTPMTYTSPGALGCGLSNQICGLVVTEFGSFNIDAVDRGLVLYLFQKAQLKLYDSALHLQEKGYGESNLPQDIRSKFSGIDQALQKSKDLFTEMNYFNFTAYANSSEPLGQNYDAFDLALKAYNDSQSLDEAIGNLPATMSRSPLYGVNTLDTSTVAVLEENGPNSNTYKISKPLLIKSTISSKVDQKINFTAVIQIEDGEGFTISLTPLKLSISPNQRLESSLSSIFERPGEYYIKIFLWNGLDEPVPLSPVKKTKIVIVS